MRSKNAKSLHPTVICSSGGAGGTFLITCPFFTILTHLVVKISRKYLHRQKKLCIVIDTVQSDVKAILTPRQYSKK